MAYHREILVSLSMFSAPIKRPNRPNNALETMPLRVTPRACARVAPRGLAHLERLGKE
jgi:hypothetical protein